MGAANIPWNRDNILLTKVHASLGNMPRKKKDAGKAESQGICTYAKVADQMKQPYYVVTGAAPFVFTDLANPAC